MQITLDKYSDVFEDNLNLEHSNQLNQTQAYLRKARAVPHAMRPNVEEELIRFQNEGNLM